MAQPVVRVCGPLTCDGPEGYQRNADRLTAAEEYLKKQGKSVWTFAESEEEIFGKGYTNEDIFTYFHGPILRSGLIAQTYFLPRWKESGGATLEREISVDARITITEVPEEWLI